VNQPDITARSTLDSLAMRDRAGVVAAVACAIHCTALPLAAGILSAVGLGLLLDERIELALMMLAGLIGAWSLWPAFRRRHGRVLPLLLFGAGLLVLIAARRLQDASAVVEIPMILIGAGSVTSAHLLNLSLCRRCHACERH
jgi:MerC mercury resistance protein